MPLRLSIIEDKVDECIKSSGDSPDIAFMKLAHSTIKGQVFTVSIIRDRS